MSIVRRKIIRTSPRRTHQDGLRVGAVAARSRRRSVRRRWLPNIVRCTSRAGPVEGRLGRRCRARWGGRGRCGEISCSLTETKKQRLWDYLIRHIWLLSRSCAERSAKSVRVAVAKKTTWETSRRDYSRFAVGPIYQKVTMAAPRHYHARRIVYEKTLHKFLMKWSQSSTDLTSRLRILVFESHADSSKQLTERRLAFADPN